MTKNRDFSSGDPAPSDWPDSLSEFLGSSTHNFLLKIKPGDATKLQIPAGTDNDQVAIAINGRWRYNAATVERASLGGIARSMDVFVTGSDNVFAPSGDGEIDSTVYAFGLAIVESAASPVGVALSRKVGTAAWDGTQFTSVDVLVGGQAGTARHAATHAVGGSDPVTPAAIGATTPAAVAAAVAIETARAEAAEPTSGELAALVGTSGAPGGGNKYVTDGDGRNTNARTPTAHAASHAPGGSDPIDALLNTAPTQPGRVANTVYRPNLTRPTLVVAIAFTSGGSGSGLVTALVESVSPPTIGVASAGVQSGAVTTINTVTFVVPPGWYYKLATSVAGSGTAAVTEVTEYTL